jgi:phage terminase small subunit
MLNAKQERFVQAFALHGNGSKAAREAGYSPKTAAQISSENLKKPEIVEALSAFRKGIEAELQINKQKVLEEIQRAISIAQAQGDASAMIAGWREIGRLCGYYAPEVKKIDLDISGKRVIDRLELLSDAELMEMVTISPIDEYVSDIPSSGS